MDIKTIGVIGAGQMGNGIAHVCALGGLNVKLFDVDREHIEKALATINGNLARQASSGRISEKDRKAALERIVVAESFADFGDADIVLESATEDEIV
jgi:3-hydroxybutyryl-CoA dehydrogenase